MNRTKIIETLAQKWTDEADLDVLIDYFYSEQINYLEELSDDNLLSEAKINNIEYY